MADLAVLLVGAGFFLALLSSPAAASQFFFSTGNPDGKMAMGSRPGSGSVVEIEAADDFVLGEQTGLTSATFTGLIPSGVALTAIQRVDVEVYRVFPQDSDVARTSGPTFSTTLVPTRVNSPSDVAFAQRDTADGGRLVHASLLQRVLHGQQLGPQRDPPESRTRRRAATAPVTGQEVAVQRDVFKPAISLPADHYFFVPQVTLSSGDFFWLSAPKPIVPPGTPFPAGSTDLQTWIRNANLDPDWLRVGTDIVGGTTPPTFNGTFSLAGTSCTPISLVAGEPSRCHGWQSVCGGVRRRGRGGARTALARAERCPAAWPWQPTGTSPGPRLRRAHSRSPSPRPTPTAVRAPPTSRSRCCPARC